MANNQQRGKMLFSEGNDDYKPRNLFADSSEENESNGSGSLEDVFNKILREGLKSGLSQATGHVTGAILPDSLGGSRVGKAIGQGAIPAAEQIPTGMREGLDRVIAGLANGQFKESPVPNEYGAGFGRGLGQMIPQELAKIPSTLAGGAIGGPWGAIAGYGLGTAATTPGSAQERTKEGIIASALPGAAKAIGKGIKGIGNALNYRVKPKEKALQKAMEDMAMKELSEQQLKNNASHLFGKQNPEKLLMSAQDKARQYEQGLGFQSAQETPEMQMMRPGQQTIPESEHRLNAINDAIKAKLGEGEPHSVKLSKSIVNAVEGHPIMEPHPKTGLPREVRVGGLREEIGKRYDQLENNLPELKIPQSVDTKAIEKEMSQLIGSKADISEAEKDSLRKILIQTHPSSADKTINGKEFFRAYRSLRTQEGRERSKAFSGLSPQDHDAWIDKANNTKKIYEDMEAIINKHFPEDTLKKLHEINHAYSTKVAPLHENPTYQQMLKHGRFEGNIMQSLSGSTKGNNILNTMIKSDPELARLTMGHQYASKPNELLKPNESMQYYAKANPEISKLMEAQKQASNEVAQAEKNSPIMESIIKNNALRQEIETMTKLAHDLRQAMNASELSKIDKMRMQKQLDNVVQKRKQLKSTASRWTERATIGAGIGAASYLGTKAANR